MRNLLELCFQPIGHLFKIECLIYDFDSEKISKTIFILNEQFERCQKREQLAQFC